jgi:hypothetical protein
MLARIFSISTLVKAPSEFQRTLATLHGGLRLEIAALQADHQLCNETKIIGTPFLQSF